MASSRNATPCDNPAGSGYAYGWSFESCTSQCTSACAKSSDCTTAVVKDKVGNGRVCADGRLGQDDSGACVPEFGAVKDAWTNFSAHCTTCGDSDACQSACATIMTQAPFVVDESRAHPDVCPSFDCPTCVGSCTSCTPSACVAWCDARHRPELHCTGSTAASVQGTFQDHSLQTRTTPVEKAMGTFYDARCKADSVRRNQDYLGAFSSNSGLADARPAPGGGFSSSAAGRGFHGQAGMWGEARGGSAGFGTGDMQDYVNDRVRRAEERRYRQLEAMGVGGALRGRRTRRRPPLPAPFPAAPAAVPAVSLASTGTDFSGLGAPEECGLGVHTPNCSSLPTGGAPGHTASFGGATGGGAKGRAGSRHMCPAGTWQPKARECRQTPQGDVVCTIRRQ